jgi:TM2 domain-containing membrane protein YozV
MTNSSGLSADTQALMAFEAGKKSTGVAYLLWIFLGSLGGHRFYLERTGSAVAQLILCVLGWATIWFVVGLIFLIPLGVWLLIDLFLIPGMAQERNSKLMAGLSQARPAAPTAAVDELAKFAALRDQGAITAEEYEVQKARLLGTPAPASAPASDEA